MDFSHGTATTTATNTAPNTSRPGTPDSNAIEPAPRSNPFQTPYGSVPASDVGSSTAVQTIPRPRYFHSRRINKEEVEKPWLEKRDPKEKWNWILPLTGMIIGLAIAGFTIYEGIQTVQQHVYCPVLTDDFSGGIDAKTWLREVEVGGFGNGVFEETTNTDENAFVQDGMLHIKPTLQDEKLIDANTVVNLLQDGSCTSDIWSNCVMVTNRTNSTIVNPVKSARLSTINSAKIKYGRVEVVAQVPAGDWMWPAIWMLPVNNTYGPWPESGEIDIMESRGNNYTYPMGGNNFVSSALHWGPDSNNDAWWRNNVKREALHTTWSAAFHTYGMEWTEKYIFTYIDTRLLQVLYTPFNQPFWQKGDFPLSSSNGTRFVDPWSQTGRDSTPFDQDFYLILNVAVGGTNGWFQDGVASKPWVDASPSAKLDFWNARDQWYPTWQQSGEMVVQSVKMWQQQGYINF